MYIGIDVGGTNIRIGAFQNPQKLLAKTSFPIDQNFETAMEKIADEAKKLAGGEKIQGLGIDVPGPKIDTKEGIVYQAHHLKGWLKKSLKKSLEQKLNCQVLICHDVVAAALGESQAGWGKGREKFIFFALGTGVASASVEKFGNILKLTQMESGHQIINWDGRKCACGQTGCLEAYIGGKYMKEIYGMEYPAIKDEKIWNEIAQYIAQGLLNITVVSPTNIIVLGGGVIAKQPHLIPKIEKILKLRLKVFDVPIIKLSKLGEDAAMHGAVSLFFANLI